MAKIKRKPKMDKPKIRDMAAFMPKDIRRKMVKEYRQAAGERREDMKRRPEQEVAEDVEDNMRSVGGRSTDLAKAKAKKLVRRKTVRRNVVTEKVDVSAERAAVPNSAGNARDSDLPQNEVSSGKAAHTKSKKNAVVTGKKKQANQSFDVKTKHSVSIGGKEKPAKQTFGLKTKHSVATSTKATVKKAEQTKRRAQTVAKAAKKAAKATARLVKKVAVLVAKATAAIGRLLLVATGSVGMVIVLFILIAAIAFIVASPFGLFASGEDSDSMAAAQQAIAQISGDYTQHIQDIANANTHDEMRFTYTNHGYRRTDNWIDVLAVYAVKTATSNADSMNVIEWDEAHIEQLSAVFWDMQSIAYEVNNEPKAVSDDTEETDYFVLYIRAECSSAWAMADSYGFTSQQREVLAEMLNGEYDAYFAEMIGSAGLFMPTGGSIVGTGSFIWPSATSQRITSKFGQRTHPITGKPDFHAGIDIAAGMGTPVLAADGGVVVSSSVDTSYGIHLLLDHGNGHRTLYAHMSAAHFAVGDTVEQGQIIGLVGSTGSSTNPHLHFEVWVGGNRVDPLSIYGIWYN